MGSRDSKRETEREKEGQSCQDAAPLKQIPESLFPTHTDSGTHIQAVTRCDLAVKDLVLDMKVSMQRCALPIVDKMPEQLQAVAPVFLEQQWELITVNVHI